MSIKDTIFYRERKAIAVFVIVVATMIGLEKLFPDKSGAGDDKPGDFGPVKVQYMISGKDGMIPYERAPEIPGPLWEKSQMRTLPVPKSPDFKTSISRADMTNATGYTGGCELPKIAREQTNAAFCLECHEQHGVVRPDSMPITPENSHPMNVAVPTGAPGYQTSYDPNIIMVDGVMQCTTCHDFWATPSWPKWIAVNPAGLCVSCHDK